MPVFRLDDRLLFPDTSFTTEDGLLAIGGDLRPERILLAYRLGIFPWYSDQEPILWWSPDPRCILIPEELKISHSMKPLLNKNHYRVTADTVFQEVIQSCRYIARPNQEGTWILPEMQEAYIALHELGHAHSIEVWDRENDELIGGLYGIAIGRMFFGESMFSRKNNASKYGLIKLTQKLTEKGFGLIDCQMTTEHLLRMGAREITRKNFKEHLDSACEMDAYPGSWSDWFIE